jgi:hypothetical protein
VNRLLKKGLILGETGKEPTAGAEEAAENLDISGEFGGERSSLAEAQPLLCSTYGTTEVVP